MSLSQHQRPTQRPTPAMLRESFQQMWQWLDDLVAEIGPEAPHTGPDDFDTPVPIPRPRVHEHTFEDRQVRHEHGYVWTSQCPCGEPSPIEPYYGPGGAS